MEGYFHGPVEVMGRPCSHGMRRTRTYNIWSRMKYRCNNPKDSRYEYYGGRGIGYDKRWEKFEAFFADMGEAPEGHSLDRLDNDGNYTKENCKWSTPKEQANNRSQPKAKPLQSDYTHLRYK